MRRAIMGLALLIMAIRPAVVNAQQVAATMPKTHEGQADWCTGFFSEIRHQAMNDNNPMIFNWAESQLTYFGHESFVNPARMSLSPAEASTALHDGEQAAGIGLWEMNGYSAGTSDRQLILALRRPDEDFCNQVAAISAQWEGAYLKLMTFLAKHPAPVNP